MDARFILVDDDPVNNMLNKHIIGKTFNTSIILCFQDPADGLSFILSDYKTSGLQQSVLFLDINMPGISGWDFLDEFQKMDDEVRRQFTIYIVSSSIDPSDKERAKKHPLVKDYLPKPLNALVLQQIV